MPQASVVANGCVDGRALACCCKNYDTLGDEGGPAAEAFRDGIAIDAIRIMGGRQDLSTRAHELLYIIAPHYVKAYFHQEQE